MSSDVHVRVPWMDDRWVGGWLFFAFAVCSTRVGVFASQVQSRIGNIEETLRMCDGEIRNIQENLGLLPQLCELLNIPMSADDENVPATGT